MKKLLSALTIMVLALLLVACGPRTPAKHEVTFDSAGGSPVGKKIVEHGGKLAKPTPNPIKEGFTFEFWMNGTTEFDFNTEIKEDLTLTANWKSVPIEKVTITFNADGGTPVPTSQEVESGKKIANPGNPTKEGFVFKHWALEGKLEVAYDFNLEVVSALDLVAVWTAKPTEPVLSYDFDFSGLSDLTTYVREETNTEVKNIVTNTNEIVVRNNANISASTTFRGIVLGIRVGNDWASPSLMTPKLTGASKVEFKTNNWTRDLDFQFHYATKIVLQTSADGNSWTDVKDFKDGWNKDNYGENILSIELDGSPVYVRLFLESAGEQPIRPGQTRNDQLRLIVNSIKVWN